MARRKKPRPPIEDFPVGQLVKLTPVTSGQPVRHVPWGSVGVVCFNRTMDLSPMGDEGVKYPMVGVRFFVWPEELFVPTAMLTRIDVE